MDTVKKEVNYVLREYIRCSEEERRLKSVFFVQLLDFQRAVHVLRSSLGLSEDFDVTTITKVPPKKTSRSEWHSKFAEVSTVRVSSRGRCCGAAED